MDLASLAALPLNVLALVALLYVLTSIAKWTAAEGERIRTRNAYIHKVARLARATLANAIELMPVVTIAPAENIADKGPAPETVETPGNDNRARPVSPSERTLQRATSEEAMTGLASLLRNLVGIPTESPDRSEPAAERDAPDPPAKKEDSSGDYIIGSNPLDDPSLTQGLHMLDWLSAGFLFQLIRETESAYQLFEKTNGENNDPSDQVALSGTLHRAQFTCLRIAMSGKAVSDNGFRKKLIDIVRITPAQRVIRRLGLDAHWPFRWASESAKVARLYALGQTHISPNLILYDISADEGTKKMQAAPFAPTSQTAAADIGLLAFRELEAKPVTRDVNPGFAVLGLIGLALIVLIATPQARDWLFANQISCTTKITQTSGAVETTCTHSPATLDAGLGVGFPPSTGAPSDAPVSQ